MTLEKQELDRIEAAKTAIGTAIAGKGVAVPSGTKLDGMAALIDGIEQGGGGEDVTAETAEYTELLTDLETAIDALPDAGSGGGGSVETCTVSVPYGLSINNTYFSDGKQVIENDTTLSSSNGVITVAKNSIVILEFTSITATNAIEVIGDATLMLKYNKYLSLNVAGDCSIVGAGGPA